MSITREFTVHLDDHPGTLGKFCRALADQGVNITAFQSTPSGQMGMPYGGKSLVRLVVDNPSTAKTLLDKQGVKYTEAEVAQVKLPHRPGELARAASKLGEAKINIDYAYVGIDPDSTAGRCYSRRLEPILLWGKPKPSGLKNPVKHRRKLTASTWEFRRRVYGPIYTLIRLLGASMFREKLSTPCWCRCGGGLGIGSDLRNRAQRRERGRKRARKLTLHGWTWSPR